MESLVNVLMKYCWKVFFQSLSWQMFKLLPYKLPVIETEDTLEAKLIVNEHMMLYCIRIRTRGGIYGKIWPEPEGLPLGSGLILPYIPT